MILPHPHLVKEAGNAEWEVNQGDVIWVPRGARAHLQVFRNSGAQFFGAGLDRSSSGSPGADGKFATIFS